MKRGKTKVVIFPYRERGYDLITLDAPYMYLGDLSGNLPIRAETVVLGEHRLVAGESEVVQLGDETGAAYRTMFRLESEADSIRYLGTIAGECAPMLLFEHLIAGEPRNLPRDLFGDIDGEPYCNLYLCFNLLQVGDYTELHITTRYHAARIFKPVVVFARQPVG